MVEEIMKAADLTPQQREWFIENFPHTKNQELADRLGTSHRGVVRMARTLGLNKTREFIQTILRTNLEKAAKLNRLRGGNEGAKNLLIYGAASRFKAGISPLADKSKDELADIYSRAATTRRETYKREQMRVRWGLPQKTKMRVTRSTPQKRTLRSNLRKKGYMIEWASNDAYITNETNRSERMEARAERMGIRFYVNY